MKRLRANGASLVSVFTGHLQKWLGYVYAELQMNRLKQKIVIKVKPEVALAVELSINSLLN